MKIEIKLENPKSCDGCPCRHSSGYGGSPDCQNEELFPNWQELIPNDNALHTIRPQACIDKYGL